MKKKRLQQTIQKYKGLLETIMNNYIAIKWITGRNRQILRKFQSSKTEPRIIEITNPMTSTEIGTVIKKNLPKNKSPGPGGSTGEF